MFVTVQNNLLDPFYALLRSSRYQERSRLEGVQPSETSPSKLPAAMGGAHRVDRSTAVFYKRLNFVCDFFSHFVIETYLLLPLRFPSLSFSFKSRSHFSRTKPSSISHLPLINIIQNLSISLI